MLFNLQDKEFPRSVGILIQCAADDLQHGVRLIVLAQHGGQHQGKQDPDKLQLVEEGLAFFDKGDSAALRASLCSTLRSASSIFGDVHAAAENDLNLFRGCGRETLRGLDAE